MMLPLQLNFDWDLSTISFAAGLGILLNGLVMGLLSASTATGALVFLPLLAWLSSTGAWQPVALAVSIACAALIPLVLLFFPEPRRTAPPPASANPQARPQRPR